MFVLFCALSVVLIFSVLPICVWGEERLAGPIPATVLKVIDGDSVRVQARIWPGHSVIVTVRLLGIDTPEIRAKCASVRARARSAKVYLARTLGDGPVMLRDIRFGKYAGRVLARLATNEISDISDMLIASGHARPYAGQKRINWCREMLVKGTLE